MLLMTPLRKPLTMSQSIFRRLFLFVSVRICAAVGLAGSGRLLRGCVGTTYSIKVGFSAA